MKDNLHMNNDIDIEEKVFVIADEALNILRDLYRENNHGISGKDIAEKMFWKNSVMNALEGDNGRVSETNEEMECIKELSDIIFNKFSDIVPAAVSETIQDIDKESDGNKEESGFNNNWIALSFDLIKNYINSIAARRRELERLVGQTRDYLWESDVHLTRDLTLRHENFREDKNFEDRLSSDINRIRHDFEISSDFECVRASVLGRIAHINTGIRRKIKKDIQRLKTVEKYFEAAGCRMSEIKRGAVKIQKESAGSESGAARDCLTGLFNRKAYDEKTGEILSSMNRYNFPSSLILCDIDNLKSINDKFGRQVGDLALKKLAYILKNRLRSGDFISRYSGNKFAVILPHTNLYGAIKAGESIRSFVDKSVFTFKDNKIPLTISIGVSSFSKGEDARSPYDIADRALYLAKTSGRNMLKAESDVKAEGL